MNYPKASDDIVNMLQGLYADEVLAAEQYTSHGIMLTRMGLTKQAAKAYEKAEDERKHAAALGRRLALFGIPPLPFGRVPDSATGGEDECYAMLKAELPLEQDAVRKYEAGIRACLAASDNDTREILVANLKDETEHIEEITRDLGLIDMMGADNYLSAMV